MQELHKQAELEKAVFLNRLMIDAELNNRDFKIGLCLLHDILIRLQNKYEHENLNRSDNI